MFIDAKWFSSLSRQITNEACNLLAVMAALAQRRLATLSGDTDMPELPLWDGRVGCPFDAHDTMQRRSRKASMAAFTGAGLVMLAE
jgi:hypothetical protein